MIALVLSGAGNYGPLQAGAVMALLQEGLQPDLIVGTSAGAMNAIYLASDPTPEGAFALGSIWGRIRPEMVGKGGIFTGLRRLLARQDSLYPIQPVAAFFMENLPAGLRTFGELAHLHGVHAYTVAVQIESGQVTVMGDHPEDQLLDGAMSSIALPPYFSPWRVGGLRYIDGGVLTKLPLLAAAERGAAQVVGVNIEHAMGSSSSANDLFGISSYALSLISDRQAHMEIAWAEASGAQVRVLHLTAPEEVRFWDFTQAERLFELGYHAAQRELDEEPLKLLPEWQVRLRQGVQQAVNPILKPGYIDESMEHA